MTKLACRTSMPIKCNQDEPAPKGHAAHLLLVRWLIDVLIQGQSGQNLVLRQPRKPTLDSFRHCKQYTWNRAGGDSGRSIAP
jgi:hypothetical protein